MPIKTSTVVVSALLYLLMPSFAQSPPQPASDRRALFIKNGCYECHGFEGQGSITTGPRIASPALPLEAFIELVRHPRSEMPAYSQSVLGDGDLEAINDYLQSRPRPPAVASIPQLRND